MLYKEVVALKTWGKHFLICFYGFYVRVHFLMFGSYLINERKSNRKIRLGLTFKNGELNFYASHVKLFEGDVNAVYDWSGDIMSEHWDIKSARKKIKEFPAKLICDTLLEQDIFSGVGNIIKNEVLYRTRVHPKSETGKIPSAKISEIIKEARQYSFEFLELKKKGELKKNWKAHTKKKCERCDLPIYKEVTGVKKRSSFCCLNCQILYS